MYDEKCGKNCAELLLDGEHGAGEESGGAPLPRQHTGLPGTKVQMEGEERTK